MCFTIYTFCKKLHCLLLICVVSTLPFSIDHLQLNSFFILLLLVNSIPLIICSFKETAKKNYFWVLLFISPYLVLVAGLVRTDNSQEASFELQKKIALVFFPVILGFTPKLNAKEIKTILFSFVISCLATSVFILLVASYKYFQFSDSNFFFYHKLSGLAGMHASYLSLYIILSVAIILSEFSSNFRALLLKQKGVCVLAVLFFSCMIFLLSARMQIIAFMFGVFIYTIYIFAKKGQFKKSLFILMPMCVVFLLLIFLIPINRERFKEAINYKGRYSVDKIWGGRALRELNWDCSKKIIDDNIFFGVGTGDVQDELQKCYVANNYYQLTYWENTKYNAHNQFLETTIGQGIIGLFLLLICLFAAFMNAFKYKKPLYFIFLTIFVFSCLTESMLERQHGVVLFALFNALFAFQYTGFKEGE